MLELGGGLVRGGVVLLLAHLLQRLLGDSWRREGALWVVHHGQQLGGVRSGGESAGVALTD